MYKSLTLLALVGSTFAKYDANMNCGQCIKSGNNFCFQGTDGMPWSLNSKNVPHTCCQKGDDTCAPAQDDTYACSFDYTDTDYALSMCPQRQDKCGSKQVVEFDEEGQAEKIRMFNLTLGDSCTFKVKSKCGAPVFKVNSFENLQANTTLDVSFTEWNFKKIKPGKGKPDKPGKIPHKQKKNYSPQDDMPPRNQDWAATGNNGKMGG